MRSLRNSERSPEWFDWRWQLRNRLSGKSNLRDFFPNIEGHDAATFHNYVEQFRLGLTPYMLSLIERDESGNPVDGDPIWEQFRFIDAAADMAAVGGYDRQTMNWELPEEMPTSIVHHKYPDRAILRVTDNCFAYCNYCYLTARTLDITAVRTSTSEDPWSRSLAYLRATPQIRDVLLSGGDPLFLSNDRLSRVLEELRTVPSIQTIRLNTRALTHNPYRFDSDVLEILRCYRVTAIEIHVSHPRELTDDAVRVLESMDATGHRPIILWRAPLLRGINDSSEVLEELLMRLYSLRVVPYYLFHFAPYALGRSLLSTSVREGVRLMTQLRRRLPGAAVPRYTLFHPSGKQDIPLEIDGTSSFVYSRNADGSPIIRFRNWRSEWVTYVDLEDQA